MLFSAFSPADTRKWPKAHSRAARSLTQAWAGKSARARHPPGPKAGPSAADLSQPLDVIERSPTDLAASKPAASGTPLETLVHFDFFLSLQLTGGGGAAAAALAGVESSGRRPHSPRLRASFLYFLLLFSHPSESSGGLWPEMAAPPPAPSPMRALIRAGARRRRAG